MSCSTAKPLSPVTTRSTSVEAPRAMASRMRLPVKTGSERRRRPRCHLNQVWWPLRVMEMGEVIRAALGTAVDEGVVAIGSEGGGFDVHRLAGGEGLGVRDH